MAVKQGWTGRVYEDFEVGDIYPHPLGRTVLPVDNSWFTLLTQNTNPIHFDRAYAAQTEFGQPLVDSTFTQIGRASCRKECRLTCRSRWSPYH